LVSLATVSEGAVLSLRRFRPPAAATRHLWISDPNNTMDMGSGKHGGEIQASDGFGWLQPESNLTRDDSSAWLHISSCPSHVLNATNAT